LEEPVRVRGFGFQFGQEVERVYSRAGEVERVGREQLHFDEGCILRRGLVLSEALGQLFEVVFDLFEALGA